MTSARSRVAELGSASQCVLERRCEHSRDHYRCAARDRQDHRKNVRLIKSSVRLIAPNNPPTKPSRSANAIDATQALAESVETWRASSQSRPTPNSTPRSTRGRRSTSRLERPCPADRARRTQGVRLAVVATEGPWITGGPRWSLVGSPTTSDSPMTHSAAALRTRAGRFGSRRRSLSAT
jgi:hypothetical protein